MGGANHRGTFEGTGPTTEPAVTALVRLEGRVYASPIVGDGGLIYVGAQNTFGAYAQDGKIVWQQDLGDRIYATALVHNRVVYVGTHAGIFYAMNADTGAFLWQRPLNADHPAPIDNSAMVANDNIIITSDGVYALNLDGTTDWHYPTATPLRSSAAMHAEGMIMVGTLEGKLLAINSTGILRWSYTVGSIIDTSPTVADNGNIAIGNDAGQLHVVDAQGKLQYKISLGAPIRGTPAHHCAVTSVRHCFWTVGTYDGTLIQLHDLDGTESWRFLASGRFRASPRVQRDGLVFIGNQDDTFYAIGVEGNPVWKLPLGSDIDCTADITSDGSLVIGTDDGRLLLLK